MELVLLLTVPVVDPDKDDLNWKRPLNCLHILTSPLLCVLTLKSGACKSPGSPGHPGGDGTEMAAKALGTAAALWSWHLIWGGEDRPAKSQACGTGWQLDGSVFPPGVGVWAPSIQVRGGKKWGSPACLGKLRHRGEQAYEGLG